VGQKSHTDTSWLIALFNPENANHPKAIRELEELHQAPSMSAFVLAELLVDFEKSDVVDVSATYLQIKKSFSTIVDLDSSIAVNAAEIRSKYKVTLGEAIVIASALSDKAELLTFDKNMRAVYERIK
jgi:predicted nucleic acid-binding protein